MTVEINLTIDGKKVSVPKGTLLVNAARKIGIDIPVFCYHPKMEPVGMCRMCLVEIGRPLIDRQTGEVQREADGSPKVAFGAKLETACTTEVSEGMVVKTTTDKVKDAERATIEFLLTSHPLDCPVCDKGGECPLQNLTMAYGPTSSRIALEDKMRLEKNYPLGDLIVLDQERCIQCARCIRFQDQIAGDPVLQFYHRARQTEIVSYSDPAFDSYFSGNTTDICPVGALTSRDFRFRARAWEMNPVASICNLCPVGCNIVLDTRREAKSGGKIVVKRVMPRQNEEVNELWICDKGRFVYHYPESPDRLTTPLKRADGKLVTCSWDEALDITAMRMKEIGSRLVTLAGGRLSNEDYFSLARLTHHQNGKTLLHSYMAGGDITARFGLSRGSNLGALGKGDAILVVACDLHEEAPLWWLRVKLAAERGATLIIMNPRKTKLDHYARHIIRYAYGQENHAINTLLYGSTGVDEVVRSAVEAFANAENAVVFYGSEGIGLETSQNLSQACAQLLINTGHTGRMNNGLVPVWHEGNLQGAWDMGFHSDTDLINHIKKAGCLYVAGADPVKDQPDFARAVETADFVVVQDLFLTDTARQADVVFPALAFTEREGTYTSGERRIQRFYQAVSPLPGAQADFTITSRIAHLLGLQLEEKAASLILEEIAGQVAGYEGLNYTMISQVSEQWPIIGREDVYYGGTQYENLQGLGVHLSNIDQAKSPGFVKFSLQTETPVPDDTLRLVPVTRLYDHSREMVYAPLLKNRQAETAVCLHPETAGKFGLTGEKAILTLNNQQVEVLIILDKNVPLNTALAARDTGIPVYEPGAASLKPLAGEKED
ncbi:MAG: NADH-quinone oxidoreductase subunit NuoG [Chloroflexi bacterium]|nr:NADH-quinone oxidoreductase subunit NuoG [Chloroflexota bacterium]